MCAINPRVDFAFKKLFGVEENKDLLIALLNAILELPVPVTDVVLKNPYTLPDYLAGKMSILDIKAQDQMGRWYNVEMQINEDQHYDKRAIYYWCKMVAEQLREGEMYRRLDKTFSINLLSFDFFTESQAFHNCYRILNVETGKDDGKHDTFELHYLELRKFHKHYAELTTALDRWATFLSRAHELDKRKLPVTLASDPAIVKAIQAVDRLFDEEERQIYELRWKAFIDEASRLDSALEKGLEQGLAQGLEQGLAQGLEQGLAQGLEQGLAQGLEQGARAKAETIARQLLAVGLPVVQIAQVTQLSEAEITSLTAGNGA